MHVNSIMKSKIKVANIIEEGRWGGPQVRITNVAKYLNSRVDTTVVLPILNSERFVKELRGQNTCYKLFPLNRVSTNTFSIAKYILTFFLEITKLVQYFNKKKFDVVHVSGGSTQFKGVIAGYLSGTKVIWHLNDTYAPWIVRFLFSKVSLLSDGFIFASHNSKGYYKTLLPIDRVSFVIQAPVITSKFNPYKENTNLKFVKKKYSDSVIIGTVANISKVKGIENLIRAASIVNQHCKNVYFIVAGEILESQKSYFESLNKLNNTLSVNNLDFIGPLSDVRSLLNQIDIYVCSSNFESSPISVWEAMSMEKPVVSTKVGDVHLFLENEVNGFIVNVGDFDNIACRLIELIRNEKLRVDFGKKARISMVNHIDILKCTENHLDAYKKIINL
jgi:glycosyltransferase involved in cell wall biosynthesis